VLIVGRRCAVHKRRHLRAQIRDGDELFQHILWQNVGVAGLFDVVARHVDVIGSQMQIGRRDRTNTPIGFRSKRLFCKKKNTTLIFKNTAHKQ
jgi:hypothetical protein